MQTDCSTISDRRPLPWWRAVEALVRCVVVAFTLLARRRVSLPREHVGRAIEFEDGSHGCVYRETRVDDASDDTPALLVVAFRLRWVHRFTHALFRAESLLNTPLFVGFPGFVSKLWLAHDEHDRYRGIYEWNDAQLADAYARALWWVLALVSVRDSIRYVVVPGVRRDDALGRPESLPPGIEPPTEAEWWRPVTSDTLDAGA
jgi:hypothetical protein